MNALVRSLANTVLRQTRVEVRIPAADRSRFDEVLVFQRTAGKWHVLLEFMFTANNSETWPVWFLKSFCYMGFFLLVFLCFSSAKGDVILHQLCGFGVVLSYQYDTDVTNSHPNKCIIPLKVLNFKLQLIMRKPRNDRKRELAQVMPFQ